MRPFGTPGHAFDLDNPDPEQAAAWLLNIIDESPDKLAMIQMPPHDDDDDLGYIEARFIAAYDHAKAARPNLCVKLLRSVDLHNGSPRDRIIAAVHEHHWVGGECINGCPDSRAVYGENRTE